MRKIENRLQDVRIEVVTTTFVASGRPEGIHDPESRSSRRSAIRRSRSRSRLTGSGCATALPSVRPVAPRCAAARPPRDEIVFANFEGPSFAADAASSQIDAPVLLLAPPFQIQGTVSLAPGSDPTQALRALVGGFFVVRKASVFDADGNALGEGEQIIVNGAAVQMTAATRQHIDLAATPRHADIAR